MDVSCREPLNERRQKMVDKAFVLMDKDGSGKITVPDISKNKAT